MSFRSRIGSHRRTSWRRCRWPLAALAVTFALTAVAEPVPDTCRIHYPSDAGIKWRCHRIGRHDTLSRLFGSDWQSVLRFNRIDRRHIYPGVRIKVPADLRQVDGFTPMPVRYPPADSDAKFILVNLTEQFLGAYAHGRLVMSFPIASGANEPPSRRTPDGSFKVTAYDRLHSSSLYDLPDNRTPYPMHYALRFLINGEGRAYWIHGRDIPGYAASHGCVGLYDEQMQKTYYGQPRKPVMEDARRLYEWAIAPHSDDGHFHDLRDGPPVLIIGQAPDFPPRPRAHQHPSPRARSRPAAGCLAKGAPTPGPGKWPRPAPLASPRPTAGSGPPCTPVRSAARVRR
jgi:hypothetical protein